MASHTIQDILGAATEQLRALPTARRDAELLLTRAMGVDRAWVMTHGDAELSAAQREKFNSWVARRAKNEPVQYILGETEFYGLTLRVTPAVLIPRPETEHVVEAVLRLSEEDRQGSWIRRDQPIRICDVGTGSGAIAIALAHELPRAEVTAVDLSHTALAVARRNRERHGVAERVRLVESDLLSAVRGETFDVVVSNPPYVREDEVLEAQVREYEPHGALFAGPTGLEVYRRLIPEAWDALAPGGWLVLEMGQGQREALAVLMSPQEASVGRRAGEPGREWERVSFRDDLQGIARVAMARRRAAE